MAGGRAPRYIYVSLSHQRTHCDDCLERGHDGDPQLLDLIERVIRIEGDQLTDEQRQRLLEIANRCPVHKALTNKIVVSTKLEERS